MAASSVTGLIENPYNSRKVRFVRIAVIGASCSESRLRAQSGSARLPLLADAAMKSTGLVSRDAARKAAIHAKRSDFSGIDGRVADIATGRPVRPNGSFADRKIASEQSKPCRRLNFQQFERLLPIEVEFLNQVAVANDRQAAVATFVCGHGYTNLIRVGDGEGS